MTWAALLFLLVGPTLAFEPAEEALVVIHVRVPAPARIPTRLHVDHIEIRARAEQRMVEPALKVLDAEALAGRAPQFLEAPIAPGVIDSIRVVWSGAEVQVGPAWTQPHLEGAGTGFSLHRRLHAGEVLVLELTWSPTETAPEATPWRPHLELSEPVLPPLGARLYVAQSRSGTVGIVDLGRGRMSGAIGVGGQPDDLVWSDLARRLYVAVQGRDEIVAVESADGDLMRRIPLRLGDRPTRMLLTPEEDLLAVVATGRDALVLLSTRSLQEFARVNVAPQPIAVAQDHRSGRLFVSSTLAGRIDVIDPVTATVERTIESIDAPGEILFLESLEALAVSVRGGRRIELFDPKTGLRLDGGLDLCGPVTGMVEQARTRRLFVAQAVCNELAILRPDRGIEYGRVPLEGAPGLPALDGESRWLAVPLSDRDQLVLIDTNRPRNVALVDVGRGPRAVEAP